MSQIILNSEQIAVLSQGEGPIVLIDSAGRPIGMATRNAGVVFSSDRILEAKRRLQTEGPGITTEKLLEKLR